MSNNVRLMLNYLALPWTQQLFAKASITVLQETSHAVLSDANLQNKVND